METKASRETASGSGKRRNLEISKIGIEGFHGRDSLHFKASVFDQLAAAFGEGGTELLTQQFLGQAVSNAQRLADSAYEVLSKAWGHEFGLIPTFRPLKESSEEIQEQMRAAFAVAKRTGEPVYLTVRAEGSKFRSAPSTQEVIEAYLTNKADGGAAEGYLVVQRRKLNVFARQYPRLPAEPEMIRVFLRQFKTDYVCTRQDYWKALKMLYDYAAGIYGVPNPILLGKIDKPHFRKKPGQRLSRDQARQYLSALRTDLEWAITACCFGLRLRRIELERLSWDDIKSDYIFVWGKERAEELPLLPIFREMLFKLRKKKDRHDGRVFSIKADTIAYHVQRVFQRAGIEGIKKGPHILRNTAGRLWLTYGGDDRANRQLLRHSDQTMTDHYSVLGLDELMVMEGHFNPMLNLMVELGLATSLVPDTTYQNITGVRAIEAKSQTEDINATLQYQTSPTTDPSQQLPDLLDHLIALGQLAQEIKHSLGGNGHWPEQMGEIRKHLQHQASK